MKKLYFTLVTALLFSFSSFAGDTVYVHGYVFDVTGVAAPNVYVEITADSVASPNCRGYYYAKTNQNGYYSDTIYCSSTIGGVNVGVMGCNGIKVEIHKQTPSTKIVEANFPSTVCAPQPSCQANFSSSIQQNNIVAFVSTSGAATGTITSYKWDFGDGQTGTGPTNSHFYSAAGTYNVKLKIESSTGCKDSITRVISITTQPNNCYAFFRDSMVAPNKFYFFSGASTASTGSTITSRVWSFGDGTYNTGNNVNVDHIYQQSGVYNVCLKIITSSGCADSICKTFSVTIPNTACHADFNYTVDQNTKTVQFQSNSYAGTGTVTWYWWDFGAQSAGAMTANPSFTYIANGTYTITHGITTSTGCKDTIQKVITVFKPGSSCKAFLQENMITGNKYSFNASTSVVAPNDSIVQKIWSFGDGSYMTGNQYQVDHIYQANGNYNVCLKIISASGCVDSICKTISVTMPGTPCHADFTYYKDWNGITYFTNTSSTLNSNAQYLWTFGGTVMTSQGVNASWLYPPGTYTVCLKLTSSSGCKDSICKQIVVVADSCKANFTYQVGTNGTVAFTNTSTTNNTANVQYYWRFGIPGWTASQKDVTIQYSNPGTYNVCMIMVSNGCTDSICKTITLNFTPLPPCTANFNYQVGTNGTVYFSNASNTYGRSASYYWNFGGNGYSGDANPTHQFQPGTYNVCLAVYGGNNCADSICKTITIVGPTPTKCEAIYAYQGLPQTSANGGFTLQFGSSTSHATSAVGDSIRERIWIWGDGSTTAGNVVYPTHTYPTAGTYNVCLVIRTVNGCSDTTCKSIAVPMVNQVMCSAQFTYENLPVNALAQREVKFNGSTSVTVNGDSIISRKWTFGDGTTIITNNPITSHVYAQPGTYTVCLTITTKFGCTKTECKAVIVTQTSSACVPHFLWQKTGAKQISFNSSTSWVPVNDTITARTWNFGDATPLLTGNVIAPVHNYQFNGVYTASLRIKTARSCEQTVYIPVTVQDSIVTPPTAEPVKIISIFPSPATIQIQTVVWSQFNNVQAELAIYDVYGIKKWSINKVLLQGNNITVIPTALLMPGPYYLRVTTMYGAKSRAFFKRN